MSHTFEFRTQPILNAKTLEVESLELLSRGRLPFGDVSAMAEFDLAGLDRARELTIQAGLRVHCNVEWTTLLLPVARISDHVRPGVVVEITERYEISDHYDICAWIATVAAVIRGKGGWIAMDDVTPTALEKTLIRALRPEIVKVDTFAALSDVRRYVAAGTHVVAERIETAEQMDLAKNAGAGFEQFA